MSGKGTVVLKEEGFDVSVVQNPTLSLEDDAAVTRRVIDAQDGPVVLVGHSYGGAVITEAGNDPNVAALVYIAAFAPDEGRVGEHADRRFPQGLLPKCGRPWPKPESQTAAFHATQR
jgi:pimeloyl-ACP methyl ester carboxylesterase